MRLISSLTAAAVIVCAGAANAQDARVPYGDLDAGSPASSSELKSRIDQAGAALCKDLVRKDGKAKVGTGADCRAEFKRIATAEVAAKSR